MEPQAWAVVLFAASVILLFLEVLLPTGGILGLGAFGALVGAVVCMFQVSTTTGIFGIVIALIGGPAAFAMVMRVFPHTPIGRRLMMQNAAEIEPDNDYDVVKPDGDEQLVGAEGRSLSPMHPTGICRFDGRRVECVAETGSIEAGQAVRVVAVSGLQIKVRPVNAPAEA